MAELNENTKMAALLKLDMGIEPRVISEELQIPYPKVLKLKKELKAAQASGEVQTLVDADKVLVHRIAEEVKSDFAGLTLDNSMEDVVEGVLEKIDAYQVLNAKVQATALKLTQRIDVLCNDVRTPIELESLIKSLTAIQMAFFNKNATNIQVLNQTNVTSGSQVSTFKAFKKA